MKGKLELPLKLLNRVFISGYLLITAGEKISIPAHFLSDMKSLPYFDISLTVMCVWWGRGRGGGGGEGTDMIP